MEVRHFQHLLIELTGIIDIREMFFLYQCKIREKYPISREFVLQDHPLMFITYNIQD